MGFNIGDRVKLRDYSKFNDWERHEGEVATLTIPPAFPGDGWSCDWDDGSGSGSLEEYNMYLEGEENMSEIKPTAAELAVKKKLGNDSFTLFQHGILDASGGLTGDGLSLVKGILLDEYKQDLLDLVNPPVTTTETEPTA